MFRIIVTRNLHRPIYSRPVCSKFLISKPPGELRNTSSIGTTTGPSNKSPSDKLEDTSSIGTTTDPSNKSPSGESRRYISSGSSLIDERYIENMFTKFQNKILFAFIGATMSIIFTVIGSSKWYVDRASEKIDDVKSILNLNETGKEIIDDIRILLDKNENKTDKNENETDKKKKK
ncbi:3899_t:CDS:2 [Rhizophagus irregularis]|nr:3899_t:CDS:2 [Rhizophagus irregularis]